MSVPSPRRLISGRPTAWLEAGSTLWTTGEAIYLVGLIVYAFDAGGPPAVAAVAVLQSLPSVVLAPVALAATVRIPRSRLLAIVLAVRVVTMGAVAVVLLQGGPVAAVFGLAAVDGLASTLLRPIRGALIPMIARSPEELVAANVAITTGASLASLVGPAVAAVVLVTGSVETTFLLGAVGCLLALGTALRLRAATDPTTPAPQRGARIGLGGFTTLWQLPAARTIVAVIVGQRFVRGMLTVLVATTALELLHVGDEGVGILNAAIGFGGLVGSAASVALIGRSRLAGPFSGAIVLWGVCLAAPAVVPLVVPTVALLVASGAGKALLEVAGASLLQRTVPTTARSQVLGLLEALVTAALAAGAVVASILVDRLGPAGALLAAGGLIVALVVISWPSVRRVDDAAVIPERELRLLRGVAFFRPLQLTTIEDLAGRLANVRVAAGDDVVRQGEPGDRFYIIEAGRLQTFVDGEPVRELGPGNSFGEIALLRNVPRTATVRASTDATLVALARHEFLAAVAGHTESATAAEAVVHARIETAQPRSG